MTLPKTVKIGGKTIRVVVEPELDDWGSYHSDDAVIKISSKCIGRDKLTTDTLRHEMIHAAFDIAGLSYMERFEEESVVRCLDTVFFPAWSKVEKILS
jgi:hypothetical protein